MVQILILIRWFQNDGKTGLYAESFLTLSRLIVGIYAGRIIEQLVGEAKEESKNKRLKCKIAGNIEKRYY